MKANLIQEKVDAKLLELIRENKYQYNLVGTDTQGTYLHTYQADNLESLAGQLINDNRLQVEKLLDNNDVDYVLTEETDFYYINTDF